MSTIIIPTAEDVILHPFPGPQMWALACPCPEIMYGGARGGGKGHWLILDWLRHVRACRGKARGLFLRRYLPDITDFIRELRRYLPRLGWSERDIGKEWSHHSGAVLSLRYLEREEDAERYLGWNNSWLAIDEAGQFRTPYPIDLLRATLRYSEAQEHVLRLTCNPGNVGHHWLKERYVDPVPPMTPFQSPEGIWRVFIPARLKDNPSCDTPVYRANLMASASGRAWLVKAWVEGDWNVQPPGGIFDVECVQFGDPPLITELCTPAQLANPRPRIDWLIQGADTAFTEDTRNDMWAVATGGRDDSRRLWLMHMHFGHWDTAKGPNELISNRRAWAARQLVIEGGPGGKSIEPTMRTLRQQDGGIFDIDIITHIGDKVAKNNGFASAWNQRGVWIPQGASWWPALQEQLLVFDGADGKRDDLVDACGILARKIDRMPAASPAAPPPAEIPPDRSSGWYSRRAAEAGRQTSGPRLMWRR